MDKIIPSLKKSLFDGSKELIGVKNTCQNIHDRNLLRQTLQFIKEFNSGIQNKD